MANAPNSDTNKLSSGIASFRRKPSSLLQPAKDKLLETKDQAKLDEIKNKLAALDAGGLPAPSPTSAEIKVLIDDKLVTAITLQDSKVSASVAAAIGSLDSKVSAEDAKLWVDVNALAGRVAALESSRDEIREQIRTLIDRLSIVGQQYPGPESNLGNKKK